MTRGEGREADWAGLVTLRHHAREEAAFIAETARLAYEEHRYASRHLEERYWHTTEVRDGAWSGVPRLPEVAASSREPVAIPEDEWLRRSGIPTRHHGSTFERWLPEDGQPRLQVEAWTRQWPPVCPWLVLLGNPGCGKTHLAVAAARYLARTYGVLSQFWTPARLEARYKATYDEESRTETEAEIDQQVMRVPLLVLDDVGTTKLTEWSESKLFALLDARYGDEKPTIFTLNVRPEDLGHARIHSRLMDRSSTQTVVFTQGDYRLRRTG